MKHYPKFLAALTALLLALTAFPVQAFADGDYIDDTENWTDTETDDDWDDEGDWSDEDPSDWDDPGDIAGMPELVGDVNGDGEVSVIDVIILQGYLLGHDNVEILAPWNADINGDGTVDIFDLAMTKRIVISGGQTTFPTEPTNPTEPTEPTAPPAVTGGSVYKKIALKDTQAGVIAYEGILPDGWTVQMQSNWTNINHYAGQENVIFTSPDGKAAVQIASPQSYTQSSTRNSGQVVISEYTTYLNYMDADAYIENYIQNNYQQAEFTGSVEIPAEQIKIISDYAALNGQYFVRDGQGLGLAGMTLIGTEGTMSRRQYRLGTGCAEYSCGVSAFRYTYQIASMFPIDNTEWTTLNTVAYVAEDQAAFDKYYSEYEMIAANGYFTAAFFSVNNYVMIKIAEMMTQTQDPSPSGTDIASTYSSSGTEISSSDMDTQDRVMQAWDDVIKEQDRYKTSEGDTLITSMYHETVAQDGDWFYVGNRTGIPDGYTELPKITPANP